MPASQQMVLCPEMQYLGQGEHATSLGLLFCPEMVCWTSGLPLTGLIFKQGEV